MRRRDSRAAARPAHNHCSALSTYGRRRHPREIELRFRFWSERFFRRRLLHRFFISTGINRHIRVHLLPRVCRRPIHSRHPHRKWNLQPIHFTIVLVIGLKRKRSQRTFDAMRYSQQQTALHIEVNPIRSATLPPRRHHIRIVAVHIFDSSRLKTLVILLEVFAGVEFSPLPAARQFIARFFRHLSIRSLPPANIPVHSFHHITIRPVHDRKRFVRRRSISLNRRMKTVRPFHTTLLRTRPILLNRPASPYRIYIFRQYFIHARRRPRRTSRSHTSRSCSRLAGFRHPTCGIRRARKRRNISCLRRPPMARVACYFPAPVEIILVDCKHHLHHVARPLLGRLVIVIKVVCFVAIVAAHAQRSRYVPHRRHQLASGNILQHLNILESLTGSLLRLRPSIAPREGPTHEGARRHSDWHPKNERNCHRQRRVFGTPKTALEVHIHLRHFLSTRLNRVSPF